MQINYRCDFNVAKLTFQLVAGIFDLDVVLGRELHFAGPIWIFCRDQQNRPGQRRVAFRGRGSCEVAYFMDVRSFVLRCHA